jgi:hypothetical protein
VPTYLVRLINNHDLVGIFIARDFREMLITIDECTDPGSCEYVSLDAGGIMWTDPAIPIPIDVSDTDDAGNPVPWGQATFTEVWQNYLHGFARLRWKRFFEPDVSDVPEAARRRGAAQQTPAKILPSKIPPPNGKPD